MFFVFVLFFAGLYVFLILYLIINTGMMLLEKDQ